MDSLVKWRVFGFIVFGLIVWQTGWIVEAAATTAPQAPTTTTTAAPTTTQGVPTEITVLDCNNTCTDKERCVPDDGSSLAQANLGELPRCVLTNECQYPCSNGRTCCGDTCECIWPRYRRDGNPSSSYCDGTEQADPPTAAQLYADCVLCNPNNTCPDCPASRTCTFAPGNPMGTCECLPGTVENKHGECVNCRPCPEECPLGQVCLKKPEDPSSYCGCLPGTRLKDGKCVPTPACPLCSGEQVCVIHGAEAVCVCPQGTVWAWEQCMPIAVCPDCPEHEICVIPNNDDAPYCKCKEGYLRQDDLCVQCTVKYDECYHHSDCHHGKLCSNGQCECPKNYTPKWGKCIRPGLAGGICDNGECYGKHVTCGTSGYCECASYAYKDPQPVCIQKKKFW